MSRMLEEGCELNSLLACLTVHEDQCKFCLSTALARMRRDSCTLEIEALQHLDTSSVCPDPSVSLWVTGLTLALCIVSQIGAHSLQRLLQGRCA